MAQKKRVGRIKIGFRKGMAKIRNDGRAESSRSRAGKVTFGF